MEYTENLTLALVGDDDLFDEAYLNANFEKIDAAYVELSQRSGGGSAPALASAVAEGVVGRAANATKIENVAKYDISGIKWEQGTITSSGNSDSTTVIRTADYVIFDGTSVTGPVAIFATDKDGGELLIDLMLFDENKNLLADLYWLNSGTENEVPKNTRFLRVCLKRSGEPVITPDILGSCVLEKFL